MIGANGRENEIAKLIYFCWPGNPLALLERLLNLHGFSEEYS